MIKLPDGTVVTIGDWKDGTLNDATCDKCGRLVGLIYTYPDGRKLCKEHKDAEENK